MKFKFEFKVIKTKYGNFLEMVFSGDKNTNILTSLFNSSNFDLESKSEWIEKTNNVLENKTKHETLGVEAFDIDIESKQTSIYFYYPEDNNDTFILTTDDFKEIIEIWFNKLEEFHKTGEL